VTSRLGTVKSITFSYSVRF
jgi:hypothetical protein